MLTRVQDAFLGETSSSWLPSPSGPSLGGSGSPRYWAGFIAPRSSSSAGTRPQSLCLNAAVLFDLPTIRHKTNHPSFTGAPLFTRHPPSPPGQTGSQWDQPGADSFGMQDKRLAALITARQLSTHQPRAPPAHRGTETPARQRDTKERTAKSIPHPAE